MGSHNEYILQEFSYPTVIAAMEANLGAFITYCANSHGAQALQPATTPEYIAALVGLAQPSLNAIMRIRFVEQDIEENIRKALYPFKRYQLPMLWWLFPGTQPANLGMYLEKLGMQYTGATPGMALRLSELPQLAFPADFTIEEVQDKATLDEWIRVSARSFNEDTYNLNPETDAGYIDFEHSLGWGEQRPYRRFLGRVNRKPVTTSAIFTGAGVVGLYSVGTLPEFRRQGFGKAISLTPLLIAQAQGYRIATLQSSLPGYRLYNELGFRECCRIYTYLWTP